MSITRDAQKILKLVRDRRFANATRTLGPAQFEAFYRGWNVGKHAFPVTVTFDREREVFRIADQGAGGESICISRAARVKMYRQGVQRRIEFLWSEYLADSVPVSQGDVVLDIGANVGEFSRAAQARGATVFACEPDPTEFRSLALNLAKGTALNIALWNERKTMTFYQKNDSGDSSLIEMAGYAGKIEVEALPLDEVHRETMGSVPIKLIKLEAEGAEPEIIQGGTNTLRSAQFVAVDAGPERGFEQQNTVIEVLNAMTALGFELVRFGNFRYVMLFRNRS